MSESADNSSRKAELRREMRRRQASFSEDNAREEAKAIWKQVEQSPAFQKAGTILIYMDIAGEVPTRAFLEKWAGRKRFAIPKIISGTTLTLKEYSATQLESGPWGICEPSDTAADIPPEEIEFALIPGVAFSPEGTRLGRGRAYYDRLLTKLECPKAGICFSYRVCQFIPSDIHDVPMNQLFSIL